LAPQEDFETANSGWIWRLLNMPKHRRLILTSIGPQGEGRMLTGSCHCGKLAWTFKGLPESATACNCSLCRRYGVLWIYDYQGERIEISGSSTVYTRKGAGPPSLEIHFCGSCGCVTAWRGLRLESDGRRRIAVNIRLAEPGPVARDGRCVADMWF
jgi:hypothetical protein